MLTVAILAGREPSDRYSLHRGYADAVWDLGATPLVLVPPTSPAGLDDYVRAAAMVSNAVCITGGGDVDPGQYGTASTATLMDIDPLRDQAEIACVLACVRAGRPLLGICRGIQVVAVALGGSLVPDLPAAGYQGHWEEERQHEPVHPICALPGSIAAQVLAGRTAVNSIHHQAVEQPGPDLVVAARSADGVIEAVEGPGILGIQWHPERLRASDPAHDEPFRWLINAAACNAVAVPQALAAAPLTSPVAVAT
jgi:putative glutamine amidotransferase